jgi:hypothetical protein
MEKITLGFITGCLNKQKNILPEHLYHQKLLDILKRQNTTGNIDIALSSYVSYSQFKATSINFIKNKNPDIVFIFLRPFPLMPLNKPLIKYKKSEDIISWSVHPSLFNRKNFHWDEEFSKHEKEIDFNYKHRNKIELRDINLLTGFLLGLNAWCVKFLINNIKEIQQSFTDNNKIFFISLPQNPESVMGNYICKLTNKKIGRNFSEEINFVDISRISKYYFENDGIHFNSKGHEYLAQLLYEVIKKEICPEYSSSPGIK